MRILNWSTVDYKELIEYITKEVMKKIQGMDETILENEPVEDKDRVLAIPFGEKKFLKDYQEPLHIDYLEDLKGDIDINSYKYLVLGGICNEELVNIAIGLPRTAVSSLVIDFILQNKRIYILNEGIQYHQYKDIANIPFYNMLKSYEEKLETFGVNFINKEEINKMAKTKDLQKKVITESVNEGKKEHGYLVKNRIITEGIIRNIYQKGHMTIMIKKNSIITPLAQDYIRSQGMDVLVE